MEKPLEHRESVFFSGRRKRFTSEQKTAGMIGDGMNHDTQLHHERALIVPGKGDRGRKIM